LQDKTLVHDDKDSSMSEVSEGEEDILAECISAAMPAPTNNRSRLRKSPSDNALKKKSAIPKPEPAQQQQPQASKSRLPTKSHPQNASTPQSKKAVVVESPAPQAVKKSPGVAVGGKQLGNAAKPPRPTATTAAQSKGRATQPPSHRYGHALEGSVAANLVAFSGVPVSELFQYPS
jgi:hypothetical protein